MQPTTYTHIACGFLFVALGLGEEPVVGHVVFLVLLHFTLFFDVPRPLLV